MAGRRHFLLVFCHSLAGAILILCFIFVNRVDKIGFAATIAIATSRNGFLPFKSFHYDDQ